MTLEHAKGRYAHAVNILGDIEVKDKIVLDIGCGAGNMLLAASAAGAKKTVGIDINLYDFGDDVRSYFDIIADEQRIDIQNTVFIEGVLGIGDCRFEDNSFDVITLVDALEHLQEPTILFKEIKRILKWGGEYFLLIAPLFTIPR